jgi:glycine/D-amino acid oxidase-like deaminating enzyme/nitrite reductase/ring-hydroxylating ferredoxin subunit
VTSQHDLIYDYLTQSFGKDTASRYAQANENGKELIASIIRKHAIDCDFQRKAAYVFAWDQKERDKVLREVAAAKNIGLPASFDEDPGLPFKTAGAVRFDNQAQFHPRKFLLALAGMLPETGTYLFEDSKVHSVQEDGDHVQVKSEHCEIHAKNVVLATHFPFNDRSILSAQVSPWMSHIMAIETKGKKPGGMYISSSDPTLSIRTQAFDDKELILVLGETHKLGDGGDDAMRFRNLEKKAREIFDVEKAYFYWSTFDYQTTDRIPFIGRYPGSKSIYIATGFGGWGMTHSTVAAMMFRDLLRGLPSPLERLYSPSRINLESVKGLPGQGKMVLQHLVLDKLKEREDVINLAAGEGKIVEVEGSNVAAYRDGQGALRMFNPSCTHMGCSVNWNTADKTWDCPCHGSRFDIEGKVVHGPAMNRLDPAD